MHFAQFYLDCLSQASYLIGDETTGRAVVVDPRRDIDVYLDDARAQGLTIEGIVNTHFNADYANGHLELAAATGAWIGYGDQAQPEFAARALRDGERISLGEVELEIMSTPGHTPESISVIVREHAGDEVPYGVCTGDCLFIGDVGRPDLLASSGVTAEELGAMLYDSVQHRLMGLPDDTRLFPAHGAGSACGKNLSTEKSSTIGEQRRDNYACQPMSEAEFIETVTEGQPPAPEYFAHDVAFNKRDREVGEQPARALSLAEVEEALAGGAVLHDARPAAEFAAGHVAGAVNVPHDGRMAETLGVVFAPSDQVVVLAPEGLAEEVVMRHRRIGFDGVVGYVADVPGLLAARGGAVAERLTPAQADDAVLEGTHLLDVRGPGEVAGGMVPGAVNIPLPQLVRRLDEVPRAGKVLVNCAGGWRSSVAASVLRARGYAEVADVLGGYGEWSKEREEKGLPLAR